MKKRILSIIAVVVITMVALNANAMITESEAVDAAGKHVQGKLLEVKLDNEKRVLVYEVKIFDGVNAEHKLKINAIDGSLVSKKWESVRPEKVTAYNSAVVTYAKAVEIAQSNLAGSKVKKAELKVQSGMPVFKVELINTEGIRYDAYVNAVNGSLINMKDKVIIGKPAISLEQAEKTALENMNGTVHYTKLDEDNNRLYYEVTIISQNTLYETKVDAMSGKILKTKMK